MTTQVTRCFYVCDGMKTSKMRRVLIGIRVNTPTRLSRCQPFATISDIFFIFLPIQTLYAIATLHHSDYFIGWVEQRLITGLKLGIKWFFLGKEKCAPQCFLSFYSPDG